MELPRFYCEKIDSHVVILSASESHHLSSVRRINKTQQVELFDGRGKVATAVVEKISKDKAVLKIEKVETITETSGLKIIIAPSIAKSDRFDWLVSKCTELGVDQIYSVIFERTVKLAKNPKALERWQKLAISAAKQCRRNLLPQITAPESLPCAVDWLKEEYPSAILLYGSLDKTAQPLIDMKIDSDVIAAFIGPEGGLTKQEEELLKNSDAKAVRLTDTVLRTETAAVSFASILSAKRSSI